MEKRKHISINGKSEILVVYGINNNILDRILEKYLFKILCLNDASC